MKKLKCQLKILKAEKCFNSINQNKNKKFKKNKIDKFCYNNNRKSLKMNKFSNNKKKKSLKRNKFSNNKNKKILIMNKDYKLRNLIK